MIEEITIPAAGVAMTEATVLKWMCVEGDSVKDGDPLLEIETDKVEMEIVSPRVGVVGPLLVAEGDVVAVGAVVTTVVYDDSTRAQVEREESGGSQYGRPPRSSSPANAASFGSSASDKAVGSAPETQPKREGARSERRAHALPPRQRFGRAQPAPTRAITRVLNEEHDPNDDSNMGATLMAQFRVQMRHALHRLAGLREHSAMHPELDDLLLSALSRSWVGLEGEREDEVGFLVLVGEHDRPAVLNGASALSIAELAQARRAAVDAVWESRQQLGWSPKLVLAVASSSGPDRWRPPFPKGAEVLVACGRVSDQVVAVDGMYSIEPVMEVEVAAVASALSTRSLQSFFADFSEQLSRRS